MLPESDIQTIQAWIDNHNSGMRADLRDQIRYEFDTSPHAVTIFECRPPWKPEFGPDWTRLIVAQLRSPWSGICGLSTGATAARYSTRISSSMCARTSATCWPRLTATPLPSSGASTGQTGRPLHPRLMGTTGPVRPQPPRQGHLVPGSQLRCGYRGAVPQTARPLP